MTLMAYQITQLLVQRLLHVNKKETSHTSLCWPINSSPREQIGRHLADDIFKRIFLNANVWISINISLKFISPNRRQAIIWTNADPIHWRIYAAPGEDELKE